MAMPRPSSPRPSRMLAMLPVVVALLQTLLLLPSHAQNPNFVWCPHTSNYTTTSQFKRNLDRLLANLSTLPTPDSPGHFHSFSTDGPDAAYGFVQCRGDVLPADCATCLRRAASVPVVVSHCPLGRVAAIRYEDCLLRYSDEPLLGVLNHGYFLMVWNTQNITDRIPFNQRLTELVTEITTAAAAGSSRFAVGVKNFSEFRNIYGLVECTMDLSTRSCEQCLRDLTNHLPRGQVAGSTLSASCFLKYDTSPFFALSIVPPPPPPPLQPVLGPPPTSSTMVPLPADGSGSNSRGQKSKTARMLIIIIIVSVVAAIACLFGMTICFKWRRSIQKTQKTTHEPPTGILVSLVFDLKTLKAATGNFSDANKLGEGGFGPVYKGVLPDGQKIAVKKLSSRAGQGLTELKNEVGLVAKLEHRNLARLLGFCIEEEQKMVVYEYLPNTSLDKFLFDPVKRLLLSWERRYNLIEGITRGLIYLHEESQLRIIHRDLKASNILLDEHMSPKIADFGLAKLFGADDVTHGHTKRIAGTLGYMPPEYAINGRFSTKVDVFGFGVLTLEIVTGRRNGSLDEYSGNASNLISYVWCHWNKGSPLKVLDPTLERYQSHQVIRCIHIALLCVQQDPSKRPSMSTVGLMLSSSSMMVPPPSTPAFLSGHNETSGTSNTHFRDHNGSTVSKKKRPRQNMDHQRVLYSVNEVTVTDVGPR